jgi:hypothetical protein
MLDLKTIYNGAANLINQLIKQESFKQGHYLTGAMDESIEGKVTKDTLEGFSVYYTQYVNDGVPSASASFKQAPFLIRYFQQRGLPEKEATAAAFATIKTWMKTGMSTPQSKRFSSTGSRQNFVENALVGGDSDLDEYMTNNFDFAVEEEYQKEKSETL